MQTLQTKTLDNLEQLTELVEKEAIREQKAEQEREKIIAAEQTALDESSNTKVTLVPSPNFTDAKPVGTFLPVNMADETVTYLTKLNRKFDFVDFIKEKLNYSSRVRVAQSFASEQIDALVMAINQFEKNSAFILGDMAGIGKGRVCAGAMRYAYQKGLIPIFVTHKPYLFSDIYRDLNDIDGFGIDENGKRIDINPIVMHPDGLVYEVDKFGEKVIDPLTGEKKIAFSAFQSAKLNKILAKQTEQILNTGDITLPGDYNAVLLPYSTIGMTTATIKQEFLEAICSKALIIFDESHNAASANVEAKILQRCTPLVEFSSGVLFSSATYAKSPAVFNLYVIKTALRTAVPTLESITNALKVGGENVSEYIATGLVKEGQMIRRERSFSSCKKVTEYVGMIRTEAAGKVIQTNDPNDKQKEFFNEAISYFKELRDFSNTPDAKLAIKTAIERECANANFELVSMKDFNDLKSYLQRSNAPDADKKNARDSWIAKNRGKFILKYKEDSISPYKQTFRENLFLSIKAKFTADLVLDCLNKEVKYTNFDGTEHYAPMKPLIAMKSTGTAIFRELDLQLGDQLKNDFSEYLQAIYKRLFSGKFQLRKVLDDSIFKDENELLKMGIKPKDVKAKLNIKSYNYDVLLTDFFDTPDGLDVEGKPTPRQRIIGIQNKLNAYNSNIPFSVIDYLKYRIESVPRSSIYYKPGTFEPKYGKASSPFYSLLEATGRELMLEKIDKSDPNSLYVLKKNDRIQDVSDVYEAFNNGSGDVMLINVVASTGGSAQSSSKFVDKRPRNMFIIQFELDVNTEVQKRGRINRTGQVNSPTYTYIITQIPVEQRQYLMFRKKLRKLDANTSANQVASVEASEITDKDGDPIEDIFNPYGFDVFVESFINVPANNAYKLIYDSLSKKGKASAGVLATQAQAQTSATPQNPAQVAKISRNIAGGEQDEENYEAFNAFVRELELYPVDNIYDSTGKILVTPGQKPFFDEMQILYKNYVRDLIQKGEYQLELIAREYKAVLRQSTLVQENAGTSVFSSSLFLSDYFTLNDRQVWSRDRVRQKIAEIAGGQDPQDRHIKLVADFERESKIEAAAERKVFEQYRNPVKTQKIHDIDINNPNDIEIIGQKTDILNLSEIYVKSASLNLGDKFKIIKPNHQRTNYTYVYVGMDPQTSSILVIDENEQVDAAQERKYRDDLDKFVSGMQESNAAYLKMLKYFTPGKPIIYNGNVGMFLGVVLKDPKGRYKYAPALMDFMFAFLSGYTTLRFNLTGPLSTAATSAFGGGNALGNDSQIAQLRDIVTLTQVYIDSYDAPNAQAYKDQVTAWKANPWLRIVKRFYTGNILSGIVKANEDKSKGGPSWQLARFTNIDGSYTTAVQLNVDSKMLEMVEQKPKDIPLAVNAGSTRFIKYLQEMPISTSENSAATIADPSQNYTMPIWNMPSPMLIVADKYASRALAIVKTQEERKNVFYPIINFIVCQNYKIGTDKATGKDVIVDIQPIQKPNGKIEFPNRWNYLYHDDLFASDFDAYMTKLGRVVIKYGSYEVVETNKAGVQTKTTELQNYGCLVKKFSFNLLDSQNLIDLQAFLNRLSSVYQVSFEFRSSAASYLNTQVFTDIDPIALKASKPEAKFDKGEYVYQLRSAISDELLKQIPNLIEKRTGGAYGEIVTELPLTPTQCKIFEAIPIKIPDNIVYVKMALSVLDDTDKTIFIKELEDKAKTLNVIEVGTYVDTFLSEHSVPTIYFFGNMDVYDIGNIFQNYALNKDISKLVSASLETTTKPAEKPKDKVTFEDAERFLMFLNP